MYQVVQPTTSQLEVFYVDRSQSLFYFVSRDLTAKLAWLILGPFSHHETNQRDVSGIKSRAIGMDSVEINTSLVMMTECIIWMHFLFLMKCLGDVAGSCCPGRFGRYSFERSSSHLDLFLHYPMQTNPCQSPTVLTNTKPLFCHLSHCRQDHHLSLRDNISSWSHIDFISPSTNLG